MAAGRSWESGVDTSEPLYKSSVMDLSLFWADVCLVSKVDADSGLPLTSSVGES